MKLAVTDIHKSLNKAYLKQDLNRSQIDTFKTTLQQLLDEIEAAEEKQEHEEHFKNNVADFLKETYYKNAYYVNINRRKDLVVHNGKSASDPVGVIIEAKKPSNEAEMITARKPNAKALHELILYYFEEREEYENIEVKNLVATNAYEWFIFDENEFDKVFYRNTKLKKLYQTKKEQNKDNPFFYAEAGKIIDKLTDELHCTYFNLKDFTTALAFTENEVEQHLVELYKIFSPEHLLKKPFANDSNTLNKEFYNELLHIIGLEERPDKGKKLIFRKKPENRDDGSLLENTINILKVRNKLNDIDHPEQFGETEEDQYYSIGLELCITWLNRILFLKLLEGQLIKYHNGDPGFAFIDTKRIQDFDELDELFFEVLAVKAQDRSQSVSAKYGNIPYLNSSLFEASEIERQTIQISDLKDRLDLKLYGHSVLHNKAEYQSLKQMNTLHYLFEFLSAYNFSSDSSANIQEENKTIINASVLGLIFEKINGYKDGSFFTPGFITMYMCRETIRRAVAQKFKEQENDTIEAFDDVKNYCHKYFKAEDLQRYNRHIDSLKICDPAVGSGHFLVSALNEMIAIKSELGILVDDTGTPLNYEITVDNDELTILSHATNKPFAYTLGEDGKPPQALQKVQVTLFCEKQKIIENCLFGVDINPKSVLICRLRLWIELLKNAYYLPGDYTDLETLPNIDINIKCGNSLISRFDIHDNQTNLPPAVQQKMRMATEKYKEQVILYKSTTDRQVKQKAEQEIKRLKEQFAQLANPNDEDYKKLKAKEAELGSTPLLFTKEEQDAWTEKFDKLNQEVAGLKAAYDQKLKDLYGNAFEWRFEFPEVLDENGNFKGFDVVIGNPPYIRQEGLSIFKPYFKNKYPSFAGTADIYVYFVDLGSDILTQNRNFIFIIPNKWMRAGYGKSLRSNIKKKQIEILLDFGDLPVFEEASTYPCILGFTNTSNGNYFEAANIETLNYPDGISAYIHEHKTKIDKEQLQDSGWSISDSSVQKLLSKIKSQGITLGEYVNGNIFYGIKTGLNEAFVIDAETKDQLIKEDPNAEEIIKPFLAGKDIKRYQTPPMNKYLILFKSGQTKSYFGDLSVDEAWVKLIKKFPSICDHLSHFEEKAKKRYDKGQYWWELRACDYYEEFEKPKVMLPDISLKSEALFDNSGLYCVNTAYIIPNLQLADLGILNSKLILFYYSNLTQTIRGGYYRFIRQYLEQIPIVEANSLESYVDKIISLKRKDLNADTTELEGQIDQLVYQLYGLTEEEIAVVENSLNDKKVINLE